MGGLFGKKRLTVFLGDLVIVGMNFAEREKTVTVSSEINECSLQGRLHPSHFRKVDITLYLLAVSRLKIEFFNTVAFEHRHAGFFRVARIDQHARGHYNFSNRAAARGKPPGRREHL